MYSFGANKHRSITVADRLKQIARVTNWILKQEKKRKEKDDFEIDEEDKINLHETNYHCFEDRKKSG